MSYCGFCGAKLEEGQICTCEKAQALAQKSAQMNGYQQAGQGQPGGYQQQAQYGQPGGYQQQAQYGQPGGYQQQYQQGQPGGYQQQAQYGQPGGYQQQAQYGQPGGYQQQYYQQAPKKPVEGIGSFSDSLKNLANAFKAPSTGIGKYVVSDSLWTSIIAIGVQALLSAFVVLIVCGKINAALGGYSLFGAAPFFLTILYSLIMSVLLALVVFVTAKIFKAPKINIIRSLNAAAVKAAFVSPLLIICLIITAVNPTVGLLFFYIVPLIGASIFMSHIFDDCGDKAKDMKVYTFAVMVVFVILFFVLAAICWKSYIPSEIRNMIDNINSISDLLEELF